MTTTTWQDRVLEPKDRAFWDENGYVMIHNAVPQENLDAVVDAIWAFLEIDRNDSEAWYKAPISRGGMLEMYHHPALWNNRQHPRVYGAFADIWQRDDLWVSIDRANMNPPARADWDYQGMYHWDVDTSRDPIPFQVQGVLYLADTPAEGGGFQCVPGFHREFYEWVKTQPADRDPRQPDRTNLEFKTIPGKAGDLLIWHSLLPHGNSRNKSNTPRLAQYITMYPSREDNAEARQQRIQMWENLQPPQGRAFPGDPRGWEKQQGLQPQLTELGRKLVGLDRWR